MASFTKAGYQLRNVTFPGTGGTVSFGPDQPYAVGKSERRRLRPPVRDAGGCSRISRVKQWVLSRWILRMVLTPLVDRSGRGLSNPIDVGQNFNAFPPEGQSTLALGRTV